MRIRNVVCEYTLEKDVLVSSGSDKSLVPVFHMFGTLDSGEHVCAHIHGVLPYCLVRVGSDYSESLGRTIRARLNDMIYREIEDSKPAAQRARSKSSYYPNYIHSLEAVEMRNIYGFHPDKEWFVKVKLTNPFHMNRLVKALGRGALSNSLMQPFEAHLPFTLQFFIDNGIFGMDFVYFKKVLYRVDTARADNEVIHGTLTVKEAFTKSGILSPIQPASTCAVELDVMVSDIENPMMHKQNVYSSNPGLEYIWKEEKERCDAAGLPFDDSFNKYEKRPAPMTTMEYDYLKRLRDVARQMKEKTNAGAGFTQMLNDTFIDPDELSNHEENDESMWDKDMEIPPESGNELGDMGFVDDNDIGETAELEPEYENVAEDELAESQRMNQPIAKFMERHHHSSDEDEDEEEKDEENGDQYKASEQPMEVEEINPVVGDRILTNENKDSRSLLHKYVRVPPPELIEYTKRIPNFGLPSYFGRAFFSVGPEPPLRDKPQMAKGMAEARARAETASQSSDDPNVECEGLRARASPTPFTQRSFYHNTSFDHSFLEQTAFLPNSGPSTQSSFDPASISEIDHFGVASLEILGYTQGQMPNPAEDPIVAASLAIYKSVCTEDSPTHHMLFTTIPEELVPKSDKTYILFGEDELIQVIIDTIKRTDPDILVGYDNDRLSWGYLFKRAKLLNIPAFQMLSRYINEYEESQHARKTDEEPELRAPYGRILLTCWKCVKGDLALRSYDRSTAAFHVLKKRFPAIAMNVLTEWLETFHPIYCRQALEHIMQLSKNNVELLSEMNLFQKTAEMARVYGIQFIEVLTRGTQLRVESMMIRLARTMGYTVPSICPMQRNRMCAPEQLQLVMEPKSGVYYDPVIVLDFQSLYPSMVMAYNYCYSTLLGKIVCLAVGDRKIEVGASEYSIPVESLIENVANRRVHSSPLGAAFLKSDACAGVLPKMLREIISARIMVKTAAKSVTSKRFSRILDARQLALKLVANTTYGYTAANWSGRMPCVEVADAILGKGRETLERAIKMVHDGPYEGAKVIYGDTDSMFVIMKGATMEKAFEVGRRIAADVTADNPDPVVLKLEKVYMGCVLETKKRYAGMCWESEKGPPKLESKGIETIRRDTCPLVAKTLERSLQLVFERRINSLGLYLDGKISRIHQMPYTEFVFCKEYRGHYAASAAVPQQKVYEITVRDCPSAAPLRGERVPYLMVEHTNTSKVISTVRPLNSFLKSKTLRINYSYYIKAHLMPALNRVFDLIPIEVIWSPPRAHHCFTSGCRLVGWQPWCGKCMNKQRAYVAVSMVAARDQRILHNCRLLCAECVYGGRGMNPTICGNHTCVAKQLFFGVNRLNSANALQKHRLHTQDIEDE